MFRVIWLVAALDALADVYVTLDLTDQDRVSAAVQALNARLAGNRSMKGSRAAGATALHSLTALS
jgi:hypothetical protein